MTAHVQHEGGCLCGRIRYKTEGEPLWIANCHCRSCRLATGAAFATFVGFPREKFDFFHGVPMAHSSSSGVTRCFCPSCGTALTYESERWSGEVHILVATLDHPEEFPPRAHVHTSEKLAWLSLDDDLPQHPAVSSRNDDADEDVGDG